MLLMRMPAASDQKHEREPAGHSRQERQAAYQETSRQASQGDNMGMLVTPEQARCHQ